MKKTTRSPELGCDALVRRCERTISESGWYWFIPKFQKIAGRPKFVLVDDDAVEGGYMNCKMYAGEYIGPMNIGAIEATPNAESINPETKP